MKTPTVPKKPLRIVSPEEFDQLYSTLPTEETRLLAETAIESGMRWGELTELRVKDLDLINCLVTVSRTVVEINRPEEPAPQPETQPVEHLGLTEPNAAGRRYRHGTLSAYPRRRA
ncbi:tyrosine-type recombinase/integrase [Microtetraspora glauca]|uniref:Tyrosine-type recombinase/integrase n=1 Tax=Microtetraspora glauca TaxID=1996 RepID=A0ABV3GPX8_MICGL